MTAYNRILVAVDLSPDSRLVAARAHELAQLYGASLSLIHVVEPLVYMEDYELKPALPLETERNLEKQAHAFLESLAGDVGLGAAERIVRVGATKHEILDHAKARGFDLIVTGAHGRHGIASMLGSTANALLHGTHCDILCVRVGNSRD